MSRQPRMPDVRKAGAALVAAGARLPPVEPFAATFHVASRRLGEALDAEGLFRSWQARSLGSPLGSDRYRWELSHARGIPVPAYAGPAQTWRAWRASEAPLLEKSPFAFEERLSVPLVICDSAELLATIAATGDALASELLQEAEPVMRRDFAGFALGREPWADTFAVWRLSRSPLLFQRLHPLVVALAESHAATVRRTDGVVKGLRFPFHDQPLTSATAQLAQVLLALGSHLDLAARALDHVALRRGADGGFGDGTDASDVLTTLVTADLLAAVDPRFDPAPSVAFFGGCQEPSGFWRALGPEIPWLTLEVMSWLDGVDQPFHRRFRWPEPQAANRDQKTGLPQFSYFVDLARLFAELPGLRAERIDVAFIDLIGFRQFNNLCGQEAGDDALAAFAQALLEVSAARAVRDGGDEFLLVAAPRSSELEPSLRDLLAAWPARFAKRFGADVPLVAPRIVVAEARGSALRDVRAELGRAIGELKEQSPAGSAGILKRIAL